MAHHERSRWKLNEQYVEWSVAWCHRVVNTSTAARLKRKKGGTLGAAFSNGAISVLLTSVSEPRIL
jgi:hypothetical protein